MKLIPARLTRSVGRKVLATKRNSPHIFFGAGVVGVIGSTVLACKATLKLEPTVDEIRAEVKEVKKMGRPSESGTNPEYNDRQYVVDLAYVYAKSARKLGRLYGPSILLGTASIGALTGSHVQLTRRNSALTATLALVTKAYDEYRIRIQEEIGEERELEIYRGVTEETVKENGKNKVVKAIGDPSKYSVYARVFDENNINYVNDPEMNRLFITAQQNYFNHRLRAYGHVFLNEVYDNLGFERCSAGQIVGWVYDGEGDNYIDFGMFEPESNRFINGLEAAIWLDFNVDGPVYDKI